jgi:hypothetical protein
MGGLQLPSSVEAAGEILDATENERAVVRIGRLQRALEARHGAGHALAGLRTSRFLHRLIAWGAYDVFTHASYHSGRKLTKTGAAGRQRASGRQRPLRDTVSNVPPAGHPGTRVTGRSWLSCPFVSALRGLRGCGGQETPPRACCAYALTPERPAASSRPGAQSAAWGHTTGTDVAGELNHGAPLTIT